MMMQRTEMRAATLLCALALTPLPLVVAVGGEEVEDQYLVVGWGLNVWGQMGIGEVDYCETYKGQGSGWLGETVVPCAPSFIPIPLSRKALESQDDSVAMDMQMSTTGDISVAAGTSGSLLLHNGRAFSTGWAGDGALGYSPTETTNGMKGEVVVDWTFIPTRATDSDVQPGVVEQFAEEREQCRRSLTLNLGQAKGGYTSSSFLSADGRCVFVGGLASDMPLSSFGIPASVLNDGRLTALFPVFAAPTGTKIVHLVHGYRHIIVVLDDGTVLVSQENSGATTSSKDWTVLDWNVPAEGIVKVELTTSVESTGAVLMGDGKLLGFGDPSFVADGTMAVPALLLDHVTDFSLGENFMLAVKEDFSLWSKWHSPIFWKELGLCGMLGRDVGTAEESVEDRRAKAATWGRITAPDVTGWRLPSVAWASAFAVATDDGQVYAWGNMAAVTTTKCSVDDSPAIRAQSVQSPVTITTYFSRGKFQGSASDHRADLELLVMEGGYKVTDLQSSYYHTLAVLTRPVLPVATHTVVTV